jgi:hypothetical protein
VADDKLAERDAVVADRAEWLIDAIATATQNRMFLRGDPAADDVAIEAIYLNGMKAIGAAIDYVAAGSDSERGVRALLRAAIADRDATIDQLRADLADCRSKWIFS